jgi:hypothetical protein
MQVLTMIHGRHSDMLHNLHVTGKDEGAFRNLCKRNPL